MEKAAISAARSAAAPVATHAAPQADYRPSTARQLHLQQAIEASPRQVAQRRHALGLPAQLKAGVERLSGPPLDDVRVHYNSARPAQLQAHAYAQGTDIHLAPGQEKHLPHEAWHVAQQKQGRVRPTTQLKGVGINEEDGLEREADHLGEQALRGRVGPPALAASPRPAATAPVQRIKVPLTKKQVGTDFKIKLKGGQWVLAKLKVVQSGRYDEFEVLDESSDLFGERVQITSLRNIKEANETVGEKSSRGNGLSKKYFDDETAYTTCQHPDCASGDGGELEEESASKPKPPKAFANADDLYQHVQQHGFPQANHFPYALFGGQSARSHLLSRPGAGGAAGYQATSLATKSSMHSEWRVADEILKRQQAGSSSGPPDKKRAKADKEGAAIPKLPVTTSVEDFMRKDGDPESDQHLFLTGEPHCGLCTRTLPKAGFPLAYPTEAKPQTSKSYVISELANADRVLAGFKGASNKRSKQDFPKLPTRQQHNDNVRKEQVQHDETHNGEQQVAFMLQAVALNKQRFDKFFAALPQGDLTRNMVKGMMRKHRIPRNARTFDFYEPSDDEMSESESDEQAAATKEKKDTTTNKRKEAPPSRRGERSDESDSSSKDEGYSFSEDEQDQQPLTVGAWARSLGGEPAYGSGNLNNCLIYAVGLAMHTPVSEALANNIRRALVEADLMGVDQRSPLPAYGRVVSLIMQQLMARAYDEGGALPTVKVRIDTAVKGMQSVETGEGPVVHVFHDGNHFWTLRK
jgi:hypothetical protein